MAVDPFSPPTTAPELGCGAEDLPLRADASGARADPSGPRESQSPLRGVDRPLHLGRFQTAGGQEARQGVAHGQLAIDIDLLLDDSVTGCRFMREHERGHVVARALGLGELLENLLWRRIAAVGEDLREPLSPDHLAVGMPRLDQAVREEPDPASRADRDSRLAVAGVEADADGRRGQHADRAIGLAGHERRRVTGGGVVERARRGVVDGCHRRDKVFAELLRERLRWRAAATRAAQARPRGRPERCSGRAPYWRARHGHDRRHRRRRSRSAHRGASRTSWKSPPAAGPSAGI